MQEALNLTWLRVELPGDNGLVKCQIRLSATISHMLLAPIRCLWLAMVTISSDRLPLLSGHSCTSPCFPLHQRTHLTALPANLTRTEAMLQLCRSVSVTMASLLEPLGLLKPFGMEKHVSVQGAD